MWWKYKKYFCVEFIIKTLFKSKNVDKIPLLWKTSNAFESAWNTSLKYRTNYYAKYDYYFANVWMWVQVQVKLIWRKGLKMEKWKSNMNRIVMKFNTCLLYLGETNDKGGKGI